MPSAGLNGSTKLTAPPPFTVSEAEIDTGLEAFDAALSAPANPGLSPNPVRAPWYFAGLQELPQIPGSLGRADHR